MKKTVIAVVVVALLCAAGIGAWWYRSQPRTAEAWLELAEKTEVRLNEEIEIERAADPSDPQRIAQLESEIDDAWREVVDRYPDSEEAGEARYRLLERELAAIEDPRERMDRIEAFLDENPDHPKVKDLTWMRAELLAGELNDPLGAIDVYVSIQEKWPEDPVAPKAAMACGRIYEQIDEFAAAAAAYEEVAKRFPSSPEAGQAQMRRAALLEEKLDQKREAAEAYRQIAKSQAGTSAGRMAARRGDELMGELKQSEQDEYYDQTYGVMEHDPYEISKEELNSPMRQRIRAQGFDIEHFDIEVAMDPQTSYLEAQTDVRATLHKAVPQGILLELNPALKLSSVALLDDGEPAAVNYEQRGPYVELKLGDRATTGGEVNLRFDYAGTVGRWMMDDAATTEGASLRSEINWHPRTGFGDMYTQEVSVIAPDIYYAIAQGLPVEEDDAPTSEGWTRRTYRQEKLAQNLTVAIAPVEPDRFEGPGGLPMELALRAEHMELAPEMKETMREAVRIFTDMYGPFPYERLAVVEVPDFPGGYGPASMILVGSIAFIDEDEGPLKFLAHEIAHQWWGNLVSLDLSEGSIPWLSESFATYSDAMYTERTAGRPAFLTQIRQMGNFYRENVLHFEDRPIARTLWASPMYRSLMYEKGALVLHALRREMGDEAFGELMQEFLSRHPYEIVTVQQYAELASEKAGEPMDWFFDQMLDRTGYATVRIENAEARDGLRGHVLRLALAQEEPVYRMTLDVEVELENGEKKLVELSMDEAEEKAEFEFGAKPVHVRLDPENWHLLAAKPNYLTWDLTEERAPASDVAGEESADPAAPTGAGN